MITGFVPHFVNGVHSGINSAGTSASMARVDGAAFTWIGQQIAASGTTPGACQVNQCRCDAHPEWRGSYFDNWANAGSNPAECQQRAFDWASYCENNVGDSSNYVVFHGPNGDIGAVGATPGCQISQSACVADPQWAKTFKDLDPTAHTDPARCAQRAVDWMWYCHNPPSVQTTTTFFPYVPNAAPSVTVVPYCVISQPACSSDSRFATTFGDLDLSAHESATRCMQRAQEWWGTARTRKRARRRRHTTTAPNRLKGRYTRRPRTTCAAHCKADSTGPDTRGSM